ncbi:hypothetical protein EDC14_1002175 [Hydrogenispora ethanolica]|uniref:Spore germination protein GerPA/GerPF n=1 Tax=Hydrogenispora ethanolica TaxID=1082276 RepID=A0A4R1SA83_HYDET|nr:hypothetical protein [Hydrogenispora ethanolica]TCL76416.1 hypothetical protein EDC14_1002175 [Hydrogenispora ethanolica]
MAVFVNFGILVVNSIANNAGVFFGENAQQGWDSPTKSNQAVNIYGVGCCTVNNINVVCDPDLVDTPTFHSNCEGVSIVKAV